MNVPMADLPAQHAALKSELQAAFDAVMADGAFVGGPHVSALETEIAQMCGAKHGIGVNSGTDALLLSLVALGIGRGDEVITPPFTFGATAETVRLAGATPVFADIDLATFNLDASQIAAKLTPCTKAILPVHLFGQLADMTQLGKIARKNQLAVIGDGAQAIGATHAGKPVGVWADMTTLSFYPTKNLGACGDGGMILTDDDALADQARLLRAHGSRRYAIYETIGYCSRLDGLQAALLLVKARQLHDWNEARRKHAGLYEERLGGLPLVLPCTLPTNRHVFHQYTVRVEGGRRDALKKHLESRGVSSAVYYPLALHLQQAYADLNYKTGDLPESERATQEVLSLPIHPELRIAQAEYVADCVRAFFKETVS